MSPRSFADPETHFALIHSETPVDVDGFKLGEPTGEVECCCCGRSAGAPEYIAHEDGCAQADVTSRYYDDLH